MEKCFLCKSETDKSTMKSIKVVHITHSEDHLFCSDCSDMIQPVQGYVRGEVLRDALDFFNSIEAATANFS